MKRHYITINTILTERYKVAQAPWELAINFMIDRPRLFTSNATTMVWMQIYETL